MKALVTGAAGFIGSHITEHLLENGAEVVGVDNLINGKMENVEPFLGNSSFEFVHGDIRDGSLCDILCKGVDYVFHEAAIVSVQCSVDDPVKTNDHNVTGTLNMLNAARSNQIERFIYAASSSAYGDQDETVKKENTQERPQSLYAVSKLAGEHYCAAFNRVYGLPTICLRYFNVFGPRQRADSGYAAVIPRFIEALKNHVTPTIYGDGQQTRDFIYVSDVVTANVLACGASERANGRVVNVGTGRKTSINELLALVAKELGEGSVEPRYTWERDGDVRASQASIALAYELLGYAPTIALEHGIRRTCNWWGEH